MYLSDIYRASADWEKALSYLDQPRRLFAEHEDYSGLLAVLEYERGIYGRQGNLRKMFDVVEEMRKSYIKAGEPSYLRTRTYPGWEQTWAGFYSEFEKECWEALKVARSLQDQLSICRLTRELAGILGLQGRFSEAQAAAEESLSLASSFGNGSGLEVFVALTFYGLVCLKCAQLDRAKEYLSQALTIAQKINAHLDGAPLYLAAVYEVLSNFDGAEHFYSLSFEEAHSLGRHYYECSALTSLLRVKNAKNGYSAIPLLWSNAERLAHQYEYNEVLASLYLMRGHFTWNGLIPEWGDHSDSAFGDYQLSLIYALRFNRFSLDEVLSGRAEGTLHQPIIPYCLERGKKGQQMLVALRDWWRMGMNDIGTPRPDTISPIPEGIPLVEAERIARKREPGDGSPQTDVVEQITAALNRIQGG